jgi:hypothetical protein
MAQTRAHIAQNAFTSGELSPEFFGRTDHERYFKGCKTLRNTVVRPVGGAKRRPGTRFIAAAKATTSAPLLIGYTPRAGTDYIIEVGEAPGGGYLRFFTRNGQIQNPSGELIANGTFDTDIAGWTIATTGTGSAGWSMGPLGLSGCLGMSGGAAGTASGRQDVVVAIGVPYTVQFQLTTQGGAATVKIGSTSGGSDLLNVSLGTGTYSYTITSPTALMSITFSVISLRTLFVDNVSISASGTPYEIASPYGASDLANLRWAPSADVIYLACEGFAPRKLTRTADANWTLALVNFRTAPTEEKDLTPTTNLTLSAVTGNGITVTASGATFLNADVDRMIISGTGRLVITAFTNTTTVTADVLDDFAGVSLLNGTWAMTGSPSTTLTPNKKEPKGALATLTAAVAAFRAADVGKYVHIQNGIIKLTKFTSSTSVAGTILHKLDAITGTTNWTLESESWNATDGFPTDVAFSSGDRLVWLRKDRVWLSVVGDYENYATSTLDDDSFAFRMRTAEVCQARWVIGATELFLGTTSAEFVITGGNNSPITPTNFNVSSDTTFGAALGRAIRVGLAVLFLDRSARGLRELVPDYLTQKFNAQDLLQLAQHLTPVGQTIVGLAYQRAPDSIVWAWRSDGTLLGLTYNAPEKVIGWHHHDSEDGAAAFVSTAVIPHPNGDRDQVWHAVRRTVNGQTVHYIEVFDDTSLFTDRNGVTYGAAGTDASLTYNGPATSTVTGLSHLEGKMVAVIADGAPVGILTVTGGAVTLPKAASLIEVGLPFTSTLVTMRPEIPINGTSQGLPKTLGPTVVRLYQSLGATVQGETVPFRTLDDPMDQPPALFDGDKEVDTYGWDTDAFITIEQTNPLPCEVTAVFSVVGVGG